MKHKGRFFLSFLLALVMALGLMPGMSLTAYAEDTYVASIGEIKYTTFEAAFTSAKSGQTIKLLADADVTGKDTYWLSVPELTVDLNGFGIYKTAHYTYAESIFGAYGSNHSSGSVHLTIIDSNPSNTDNSSGHRPAGVTGGYIIGSERIGVYVVPGGTFTMEGGTITVNAENSIAGVYVNGGTFIMNGGMIANNKCRGVINASNSDGIGTFTMNGGTITNNTASGIGGGIYSSGNLIFSSSGNSAITIKGNKSGDADSNVYLAKANDAQTTITINGELTNTDPIGITMAEPGVFTSGLENKGDTTNFTSDDDSYFVVLSNNEAALHRHNFNYAADSATITVTCSANGCPLPEVEGVPTATLTIVAPLHTTYGDGKEAAATLDNLDDFNDVTQLNVSADSIQYYKAAKNGDTYTKDGAALDAAPTNAGDYLAEITLGTGDNKATASVGYTIAKATPAVTAPTAKTLTYNGQAQGLVNAGSTGDGKLYYAVSTENTAPTDDNLYTTSIPTATDVGTYYVWYKVVGDANHNDVDPAKVTASIARAGSGATAPTAKTLTYTGAAQTLVEAGSATGGTMQYSLDGSNYSTDIPKGTEAGTYTVYYKVFGDANHNDTEAAHISVTISSANATPTNPSAETLTYTGAAQALVTGGSVTGGELQYALGSDATTAPALGSFTATVPTGTDAGTYYVWYRIKGDANHNDVAPVCIEVPIAKAAITPTVSITGWTYGEAANAPSVTGNTGNGAVTYEYSDATDGTYTETVPTDAGNYYVRATIAGTGNYQAATTQPLSFAIAKATITITADDKSGKYGADIAALTWQVGGSYVDGDELGISAAATASKTSDVGEYPITVAWNGNANYTATLVNGKYTIAKADLTVTAEAKSKIEGERDPELTYTVTGLVGSDKLSGALARDPGEAPGDYAITQGTLTASGNYTLTFKGAKLTVKARPITPTATPTTTPTVAPTVVPTAEPTATPTPEPTQRPVVSDFTLLATMKASGKTAMKLSWTKVAEADGYDIFFRKCDGKSDYPLVASVNGSATLSYKITGLKKSTSYKAYVKAWKMVKGAKTYIGKASPTLHAITGDYTKSKTNAKKVTVKASKVTLAIGKTSTIKASVKGVKSGRSVLAHEKKLGYYSSDRNVATVTSAGKIKATGTGSCTIYVLANNGVRASVKVTVVDGPTKIAFKKSSYSLKKGKTLKLASKITLTPSGVTTTYTWISSDSSIATVSANGVVKGIKKGTVTITVTTANGKKATTKVKVK